TAHDSPPDHPYWGPMDMFVAKFDDNGEHIWSHAYGGTQFQEGDSIASDPAGNVLVTGDFESPLDFGDGELPGSLFVAKFEP
ncbi:MAG TPA: hypothetical protein VF316_23640, partial [Polyangiaceae bacterium]